MQSAVVCGKIHDKRKRFVLCDHGRILSHTMRRHRTDFFTKGGISRTQKMVRIKMNTAVLRLIVQRKRQIPGAWRAFFRISSLTAATAGENETALPETSTV